MVAQNVALAVKLPRDAREKGKVTPPAKGDLRAILEAAGEQADLKTQVLVELAVFSGLRASELRGLSWKGVDFTNGTVTVSQRADAAGVIGPPKSKAGFRTIPLPPRVVTLLKTWKLACPVSDLDLVFPSERGNPRSWASEMMDFSDRSSRDVIGLESELRHPSRTDRTLGAVS
ncbi:site-specific integrase [Novosphingobium piscinae]|uniref:Site-specific integrase n=1 Tax=Novosphingobium piscinae TaxID=1507448 RepID=A0A7X1FZH0_9SPHN|nr:site-specific integrase [Novosphingobium piscinae]